MGNRKIQEKILKCLTMSLRYLIYIILFNFVLYAQEIKILPLGDSITKGSEGDESVSLLTGYRQSLWLSLDFSGYKVDFIGSNRYGCEATPLFDCDNAGFGGYTTSQIFNLVKTGYDKDGNEITDGPYLNYYTPDVILLHVGTNGLDTTTSYLEDLLNYIDDFEDTTNTQIWVILAKIINRVPYSSMTTTYNNNIQKMFERRVSNGDKLKIVDMENDAGMIYNIDTTVPYSDGDMFNNLHPNNSGNIKIANLFYDTLRVLLDNLSLVRLEKFYPVVSQDSVILAWETSLELNNFGFEIERTTPNNGVWENLGFTEGAGNSFSNQWYAFIDNSLNPAYKVYKYRLKQIDYNGNYRYLGEIVTGIIYTDITDFLNYPGNYELSQNYPNPFNPSTNIRFQIPKTGFVVLKIYNTLGKEVATLVNEEKQPGNYEITWDPSDIPSGIYFYQIQSGNYIETKKMLLIK